MGARNGILAGIAAVVPLALAPVANATMPVTCSIPMSGSTLDVVATTAGATVRIVRSGTTIVVDDGSGSIECSGGPPTVANVDQIALVDESSGATEWTIDLSGGALAPGVTDEGDGSSEIELTLSGGAGDDVLLVAGGSGAENIRAGKHDVHPEQLINLNAGEASPDADATVAGVEGLQLEGGDGDDTLHANGGAGTQSPAQGRLELLGGTGADTLSASEAGSTLEGGPDSDVLLGSAGADVLHAADGFADTVTCGGGADVADADRPGLDVLDGCETVMAGPGGSTASGGGALDPRADVTEFVEDGLPIASADEDVTPPAIREARLVRRSFRQTVATTLRLRVREAVWLDMTVRRVLRNGRTRGAGETSAELGAGRHALRFAPAGLPVGRYRLVLVAYDDAGNRSLPVTLRFRVRR